MFKQDNYTSLSNNNINTISPFASNGSSSGSGRHNYASSSYYYQPFTTSSTAAGGAKSSTGSNGTLLLSQPTLLLGSGRHQQHNCDNTAAMLTASGLLGEAGGGAPQQHHQQQAAPSAFSSAAQEAAGVFFPRWRTLVDNFVVEFMASLFVTLLTFLCWPHTMQDVLQFVPALALGLVLICLKDEDYFFPDTSPTVTFVLWILGGYTWTHVVARMAGQLLGSLVALWICLYTHLPPLNYRDHHTLSITFVMETIGTALEHMAVVYVVLPLLPPAHSKQHNSDTAAPQATQTAMATPMAAMRHPPYYYYFPNQQGLVANSLRFVSPRIKPKSHADAQAPSNQSVMHAAITFAGLHWCLTRGLSIEMNVPMTVLLAILRLEKDPAYSGQTSLVWSEVTAAIWGQVVGVSLCVTYVALFAPRETKFWPALLSGGRR
jgi:glycerol uptake facilitator-like aquaporin